MPLNLRSGLAGEIGASYASYLRELADSVGPGDLASGDWTLGVREIVLRRVERTCVIACSQSMSYAISFFPP